MADPHAATRELLEERPELESALEAVLAVDESGPWTFDDVDLDSGTFGELVSRGVVEKVDGEYRVADRDAVRAALDGRTYEPADGESGPSTIERIRQRAPLPSRDLVVGLVGALLLVFVMRVVTIRRVFRDEGVFLPGNDPYHYLYWVERLLAADVTPAEIGAVAEVLGGRSNGEPLTYVLGWLASTVVGPDAAATVVAWIPVVCALAVGLFVYLLAVWTTNDERVGVASVVVFALLPGHALYSGIGFFDHHAIDYVWLAVSIAGVLWLTRALEATPVGEWRRHYVDPGVWGVVGGLGIVFAAMVHTWNGAPILLAGLAVFVTVRAASDVRTDRSPLVAAGPIVAALGVGFVLAYLVHSRLAWQESVVIYSLLLVAAGTVLVVAAAAVVQRLNAHPGVHLAASAASVGPLWLVFSRVRPAEADRLYARATDDLLGREGIAETRALFHADYGVFFGPVDHFGWFLFLALPVLGWVTYRCVRDHHPRWLVIASYAYALIGFALLQIRFAGEATGVVAVLAGVGLVYLLSTVDLAAAPTPFGDGRERVRFDLWPDSMTRTQAAYLVGSVLLVASLSLFMVPAVMDAVAITDDEAEAADWMEADAADRDGADFVLSEWGRNRMFNYVVNGDADGYGYAYSRYEPFVQDADPDSFYEEFEGTVGYVAIQELDGDAPPESTYTQLFEENGSATDAADGSGHFQLAFVSDDETVKVFRPVPGATITGEADPGSEVVVTTEADVDGTTITYERRTTADDDGSFAVVVAHAGEYTVADETVVVSETAVRDGETVDG